MRTRTLVLAAFAGLLPLAPASAQVVSTSFTALTPLTVTSTSGTQVATSTQPAGPLAAGGDVVATAEPGVWAGVGWGGATNLGSVYLQNNVLSNVGGPPASGSAGPHEFLIQFDATAPVPAWIQMTRLSQLSPGQTWPTVAVDVGNDGTIDFPNVTNNGTSMLTVGGPQPVLLRVILSSQMQGNGYSGTIVEFTLQPDNNLTIQPNAIGCANAFLSNDLTVVPTLVATGVTVALEGAPFPSVLVFGFSQQPVLLPPVTGMPCLLMPSPDVLLVPPLGIPAFVPIALPPAVRPVTFHVQAVSLSPFGLATTDGFTVMAF